ncbi:hypothetical protein E2C01_050731 [Portunus trituberculatus]|uniref:Uncharacterized protein n=1 Tax=Portunus trituberculatus TaxID=210409 RepID=A0A5B7GH52_PORTR|nr:hypothetical protein [Portunus trituberculatus]
MVSYFRVFVVSGIHLYAPSEVFLYGRHEHGGVKREAGCEALEQRCVGSSDVVSLACAVPPLSIYDLSWWHNSVFSMI